MRKILAIALVFSLFVLNVSATSTPAYEAETSLDMATVQQVYSEEYIAVTELQRELIYADMKQQLLAQDGMYMYPVFKDAIDRQFNATYYPLTTTTNGIYAPHGGIENYGNSSFDMSITFFSVADSEVLYQGRDDVLGTLSQFSSDALLGGIFKYLKVPYGGSLSLLISAIQAAQDVAGSIMWDKIHDGTDCAMIMTSVDYGNASALTILQHWSNAPYIVLAESQFFDYHNYEVFTEDQLLD